MKKQMKEDIDRLFEKDASEYDYEGEMAVTQLKTIVRHAEALQAKMKPDTNLPEWVQSKITLATDYIQTASDYLHSELEEQAPVAPSLMKHRISVTVSDPDHTMVSKRKEKMQKTVVVTHSSNKEGAQKVGEKFYKKKGYVVHDSHHAGMVNEEVELEENHLMDYRRYTQAAKNAHAKGDHDIAKDAESKAKKASDNYTRVTGKKPSFNEETITEGAYEKSEENKRSADAAKKQGDMFAHHLHMAEYHDNLAQHNSEKGRQGVADQHAAKSEDHHEQAMKLKEETNQFDAEGNLMAEKLKFSDFIAKMNEQLLEYDSDDSGVYRHTKKATYGTSYQGDDDEDEKPKKPAADAPKRGRGRPAGSSGASYKPRSAETKAAAAAKAAATKAANKK
jgi:hypothetical protein